MKRLGLLALLAVVGCASDPSVQRIYNGRIVDGPFVPAEAYSAYLRGVLAEEAGDFKTALGAYEETIREDDEDPEPFTRIGDMRCRLDPKSRAADDAFAQAQSIDRKYAPLLTARARCAALRGHDGAALSLVEQVSKADRDAPSIEALYLSLSKKPDRTRAIALTVAAGEHVASWDALIAWGRTHNDPELVARGFEGLVRVAPMRAGEVEAGAIELLGQGQTGRARRVAVAVSDAAEELGVVRVHHPTVARLAVDEALARGDIDRAKRRAVRGHVPRAEIAARAVLLERPEAIDLAKTVLASDPSDVGAAMVLGATTARTTGDHAPAACTLLFVRRLADRGETEAARTFLARVLTDPIAPHDPLVGPLAVDLAVRGVAAGSMLPVELRLEVAARHHDVPPAIDAATDPKHALLYHSLIDPSGAPARSLLAKIGNAADRDPLVGFALVRAAIVSPPASFAAVQAAIAASPFDPLVLASAVELAQKSGRAEDVAPVRARLLAVARTPAEHALAEP